ncbi:unnamed protein product [Cyprideis torosa]|uniref:60S ribosomal protein L6 n=1 Tax=Cyprideis torosa TaxID=163714 RepID=A0A7R8WRS8_9CRUS|nr:unnamed protein product [Cyprideis torosa]CAG0904142.1 unnamed protein product [Cyprideis torosa]
MAPKKGSKKAEKSGAGEGKIRKPRNYEITPGVLRFSKSRMFHKKALYKKVKHGKRDPKKQEVKEKFAKKELGGKNGGARMVRLKKAPQYYHPEGAPKPRLRRRSLQNCTGTPKLRSSLTPGTVCILLTGRHKGKRVVFLKQLRSGLLLVTGPFKFNGCPLRRMQQSYVIATSTKIDLGGATIPEHLNDDYFRRVRLTSSMGGKKKDEDIFASTKQKYEVSEQRKTDQADVDKMVIEAIKKNPEKAPSLHVLYEHAAGYGLFRVKEFEDIGAFLPEVEASVKDLSKFMGVVRLVAFSPFKTGQNALDNANHISEGILHEDLQLFLSTHLPDKKKKAMLGLGDAKLAAAVSEALGVSCMTTGVVPEVLRGIRQHFPSLVKGFTPTTAGKAQLGLGHAYSRAKVKFNVHRSDNMIIQSIALLDQLDKDINQFSMRIREWYSYHFPELFKIVADNILYAQLAHTIGDRKMLTEEKLPQLEAILGDDAEKAQLVLDASKSSMGMDISPLDLINVERFAQRVVALVQYRKSLQEYLRSKMSSVAPNLSTLIGEVVGARLISQAGSLTNLAKYPASTVQILGAEKALFRALKTKGNTPKYGLLYHSTFIGRATGPNKGRISRYLANKCSLASRIDCFSELPSTAFGSLMKEQVEERLKFYASGAKPRKNLDVMKLAAEQAKLEAESSGKKKKSKKRKSSQMENGEVEAETIVNGNEESLSSAEKKKKKKQKSEQPPEEMEEGTPSPKKKKKQQVSEELEEETPSPKKKKKKQPSEEVEEETPSSKKKKKEQPSEEVEEETPSSKKKKKKVTEEDQVDVGGAGDTATTELSSSGKKKKKKKKSEILETELEMETQ